MSPKPPKKLTEGDHVAIRVFSWARYRWHWSPFAWRVVAIDPDDSNNIRLENVHGDRFITTARRVRPLPHREWIAEPSWLDKDGRSIRNDDEN